MHLSKVEFLDCTPFSNSVQWGAISLETIIARLHCSAGCEA